MPADIEKISARIAHFLERAISTSKPAQIVAESQLLREDVSAALSVAQDRGHIIEQFASSVALAFTGRPEQWHALTRFVRIYFREWDLAAPLTGCLLNPSVRIRKDIDLLLDLYVDRVAWKLWRTPAPMALFVELVKHPAPAR